MYHAMLKLSDEDWRKESREYPDSYMGDWPGREGYLRVGLGQSGQTDHLEASNFQAARETLEAIDPDGVRVHTASHWAVGWVESLWIKDEPALRDAVREMWERLDSYPVLDEEDFSEREYRDWQETVALAVGDCLRVLAREDAYADAVASCDEGAITERVGNVLAETDCLSDSVSWDEVQAMIQEWFDEDRKRQEDLDAGIIPPSEPLPGQDPLFG